MLRSALLAILVLLSLYGLSHLLTPSMRAHSFWQTPLAVVAL